MTAVSGWTRLTRRVGRSPGGTAAGGSARRSARVRRPGAAAVGGRPAVAVLGPNAVIMQGRSHLAAGGPGLAARALSDLWHAVGQFALGRLDQAGRLRLDGAGRLLHGRAVRRLARGPDQLVVALPACPGAEHEANAEANNERHSVPHLGTPLSASELCGVDFPAIGGRTPRPCPCQLRVTPAGHGCPKVSAAFVRCSYPGEGKIILRFALFGSGGETRTLNHPVNSRMLCRLSYPRSCRSRGYGFPC